MFGGHGECGLHLTGGDNRIGGDDAQHGGQLRGNHARALDHAADLPAFGAGQFDRLRLGVGGHDGVGGVGAGFGGGGKSLMGTLGTSQHVVQRQQFTDETGGADSHIIRFGADEPGDRFRGGDGLGVTGLAGAGVGTAGVQNHGLDVTVGDDLTAPLHRGGTETVRGEHACSRVERAVVDHEGQVLLAFDG